MKEDMGTLKEDQQMILKQTFPPKNSWSWKLARQKDITSFHWHSVLQPCIVDINCMIWKKEITKKGGAMMSLIPQGHEILVVPQKHNATTTMVLVKLLLTLFSKKQTFAMRQLRLGCQSLPKIPQLHVVKDKLEPRQGNFKSSRLPCVFSVTW